MAVTPILVLFGFMFLFTDHVAVARGGVPQKPGKFMNYNKQRGSSELFIVVIVFLLILLMVALSSKDAMKHHAKIYKLKNHHVVMKDDQGKWFEYVVKGIDIDFDIPTSATGRITLPAGGSWRSATLEEEQEVVEGNEVTVEEATVSEGDDGAPDGSDVGDSDGDSGGDSGGGDGGGGDGGE